MTPIISIVGKSDSGKTTLIEKLVPEFVRRGYRVATVKHDVHGFEVDREGKDSWRHKQAGAHTVVISSPTKLAVIRDVDHDADLTELRDKYIQDVDLILSEGFRKNSQPKIEVFRKEMHQDLLCQKEDNLLAIAADQLIDVGVPCFDLNDARGLVNLIEEKFLQGKKSPPVRLWVNGKEIPLSPFVQKSIGSTVRGMVSTLKGGASPQRVELKVLPDGNSHGTR
ncbi:MAG: molybdopterin-guanine dinucleotide biosynthesis protein B [Deltaproteobacteria bacterium]|nr:molybdopterin-guanine dinucleotide biosynthesis protein B [Deltaproteobacteria bacterium]